MDVAYETAQFKNHYVIPEEDCMTPNFRWIPKSHMLPLSGRNLLSQLLIENTSSKFFEMFENLNMDRQSIMVEKSGKMWIKSNWV